MIDEIKVKGVMIKSCIFNALKEANGGNDIRLLSQIQLLHLCTDPIVEKAVQEDGYDYNHIYQFIVGMRGYNPAPTKIYSEGGDRLIRVIRSRRMAKERIKIGDVGTVPMFISDSRMQTVMLGLLKWYWVLNELDDGQVVSREQVEEFYNSDLKAHAEIVYPGEINSKGITQVESILKKWLEDEWDFYLVDFNSKKTRHESPRRINQMKPVRLTVETFRRFGYDQRIQRSASRTK